MHDSACSSLESYHEDVGSFADSECVHLRARSGVKVRAGPSGLHLFDRTTGLNVLLDEVQVPSVVWAAAPRHVSVALTNVCDLACSYCYAPKSPAVLRIEPVVTWLHELDLHGCLAVGFGGGEPTLYPRFVELCQYASRHTGLAVTFTTHVHHLDEVLVASLVGSVHFVRVSMNGVGATYEALHHRSFAGFRSRLENVRKLAPFGINFLVNKRTLPDLDAATQLATEAGADEFLLLPEQPVRGGGGIDEPTVWALRRWVSQYRGCLRLAISEAGADGFPTCNPLTCETGLRAYVHIDASGVLKRSSCDREGVAIGVGGVMRALALLRTRQKAGRE